MSALVRVVLERLPDGRFSLLREHAEGGDRFVVDDLLDAWETLNAAYRPDGTPREWPPTRAGG